MNMVFTSFPNVPDIRELQFCRVEQLLIRLALADWNFPSQRVRNRKNRRAGVAVGR